MKNKCLLLLLFASFPIFSWADETLDSLLHVLDQTILAHDTYVVPVSYTHLTLPTT